MKFLVIGEVCRDIHVKCQIDRLCPEAPVPVLKPITSTETFGMAGNVAANLKSLTDIEKIDLRTPNNMIKKTRYVDAASGYIITRIDENDYSEPYSAHYDWEVNEYYDGVLISDYNKGFLTELDIQKISVAALNQGIPVFLDTKKMLGSWSTPVSFVKINEKEYLQQKAVYQWPENLCKSLIVTLGSKGAKCFVPNIEMPVDPIAVSDVSGAGDTFLAAFAIGYVKHFNNGLGHLGAVGQAMFFANRAARIAVSKRGVVAVNREEV